MAGETDLSKLLAGMRPNLRPEVFVFCTVQNAGVAQGVEPLMTFREREGITLILRESDALASGLRPSFRSRMISLEIHSSLDAVGFLAAITARLAAAGMGVNPVSAFHHDHLFVPADRADEAVRLLEELARVNAA